MLIAKQDCSGGKGEGAAKGITHTGSTGTCQPGMREALLRRLERTVHGVLREAAGRFSVISADMAAIA